MSSEEVNCLYVEKGRCGKPTEKTPLQCLFCVTSGIGANSVLLVRRVADAQIKISEASQILDVIERLDRFIKGFDKVVKEKFADTPEYREMKEVFERLQGTPTGERIRRAYEA